MPDHKGVSSSPAASRANPLLRNMAISLGVLLVPILAFVLISQWLSGGPSAVDPSSAYESARAAGRFPVLEPQGLPSGWTVTRADVQHGSGGSAILRIGYVSPTGGPARIVESDVPVTSLLPDELGGVRPAQDSRSIGGRDWQLYPGRGKERALVFQQPKMTVLVIGQMPDAELNALAASLHS
jgi:hypothetical protein